VPLAADVEDHPENATRFVLVGRDEVAPPSGHDRTTIVCFQDADRPGSLYAILGRFAARDINLTKLESRPTKRGLDDYCFVIEFEGHVADDLVADCLADLQANLSNVKFLGSYPVTGEEAGEIRAEVVAARRGAREWVKAIRRRISSRA
jgi:prephenate dehydratase